MRAEGRRRETKEPAPATATGRTTEWCPVCASLGHGPEASITGEWDTMSDGSVRFAARHICAHQAGLIGEEGVAARDRARRIVRTRRYSIAEMTDLARAGHADRCPTCAAPWRSVLFSSPREWGCNCEAGAAGRPVVVRDPTGEQGGDLL